MTNSNDPSSLVQVCKTHKVTYDERNWPVCPLCARDAVFVEKLYTFDVALIPEEHLPTIETSLRLDIEFFIWSFSGRQFKFCPYRMPQVILILHEDFSTQSLVITSETTVERNKSGVFRYCSTDGSDFSITVHGDYTAV